MLNSSKSLSFFVSWLSLITKGVKWRSWIHGSLNSSKASILVNGSPTSEFQFHHGLKQGDPLAPFLFILIMESLHLSFTPAVEAGIFKGIRINESLMISHLFYADDALFIGEWSNENLQQMEKEKLLGSNSQCSLGAASKRTARRLSYILLFRRGCSRGSRLNASQIAHLSPFLLLVTLSTNERKNGSVDLNGGRVFPAQGPVRTCLERTLSSIMQGSLTR
ncbi:RNA-directed DNA polymerase, eukaryota [Tanacetum coccineum]